MDRILCLIQIAYRNLLHNRLWGSGRYSCCERCWTPAGGQKDGGQKALTIGLFFIFIPFPATFGQPAVFSVPVRPAASAGKQGPKPQQLGFLLARTSPLQPLQPPKRVGTKGVPAAILRLKPAIVLYYSTILRRHQPETAIFLFASPLTLQQDPQSKSRGPLSDA